MIRCVDVHSIIDAKVQQYVACPVVARTTPGCVLGVKIS
jgi:hypothetical protein